MIVFRLIALLLPFVAAGLAGCATLTQGTKLPEGLLVREVAKADAGAPFAVDRSGGFAAVYKNALQLIDAKGAVLALGEGNVSALSFSPAGDRLAAALPVQDKTVLRLLDRQGKVVGETTIPEMVTSMSWRSQSQLAIAALDVKKTPEGTRLGARLYLWDGSGAPAGVTLREGTVRPQVADPLRAALFTSFHLAISPYGDEIAYSFLVDQPPLPPYQRITVRHLESGREWEIGRTSVGSGGPLYTPDGESLLVGDTHALTRRFSIPDGREMDAWPAAGNDPALSPSGSYLFLDGRLYQNGRTVVSFPSQSRGSFLPDGSGLAVSYDGKLYLVSGLNERAVSAPAPAELERLLKLRKLRSLGLISEKEYRMRKRAGDRR
jgi:hypothetical protein